MTTESGRYLACVFMLVTSVGSLILAVRMWRRRHVRPTETTGAVLLVAGSVWLLGSGFELASPGLATKVLWNKVQFLGIVTAPTVWLILALQFSGHARRLRRRNLLMLSIVPFVSLSLALTNEQHRLIWSHLSVYLGAYPSALDVTYGPMFWAYVAYGMAVGLLGVLLLVRMLIRSGRLFRWQGTTLVIAGVVVVLAALLDISRLSPVQGLDLMAVALVMAVPALTTSLTRLQRADIVPVARDRVLESMTDAVFVLDPQHRVLDLNPAAEHLIGCTASAASGRPIQEVWPGAPCTGTERGDDCAGRTEIALDDDGEVRTYDMTVSPILDRSTRDVALVIVLRDITERVRVEQALRETEAKYRLHFENVNDVIFALDREMRIAAVTPSIERHLGYKPEELIGKSALELNLLAPEHLEDAIAKTRRVFSGERITSALFEFVARDGTRKIGELSGAPLVRNGEVVEVINVARDITERVRAEARLKASLHEKEVLLKEIHHRVKNNLQVIASLLSLQADCIGDDAIRQRFTESQHRIRSMALIHERLYQSEDLARVDFVEYTRGLATYLFHACNAQGQGIRLRVDGDALVLDIDTAIPCGLILNELISNALKHAFPDGRSGTVGVALRAMGDGEYTLAVSDDGVGFPETLDFQATETLGLQLVNSLARQLNASIDLQRDPATTISITFTRSGDGQ